MSKIELSKTTWGRPPARTTEDLVSEALIKAEVAPNGFAAIIRRLALALRESDRQARKLKDALFDWDDACCPACNEYYCACRRAALENPEGGSLPRS